MDKKILVSAVAAFLVSPLAALAFNAGPVPQQVVFTIPGLIDIIFGFIWPIVVAFAIIMFIIAALQFFTAQGDPGKVEDARQFVIWGVVGMMVALLAFSIPLVVRLTIGV